MSPTDLVYQTAKNMKWLTHVWVKCQQKVQPAAPSLSVVTQSVFSHGLNVRNKKIRSEQYWFGFNNIGGGNTELILRVYHEFLFLPEIIEEEEFVSFTAAHHQQVFFHDIHLYMQPMVQPWNFSSIKHCLQSSECLYVIWTACHFPPHVFVFYILSFCVFLAHVSGFFWHLTLNSAAALCSRTK